MSFLAGMSIASWAFYFKRGTSEYNRTGTIATALISSNILMILLNIVALNISPYAGLGVSILFLGIAFLFASRLKLQEEEPPVTDAHKAISLRKPLLVLCLFIVVITINSGLMYQVIRPAFEHHSLLVSWYWALPYIGALYMMKKLPLRINRTYIFYFAIAMLGISFILFMVFDRSAISYIIVDTLMLSALGIFDIFWWSTLGEMLDFHENPSRVLGIGLSANVLGVLLGGILGNTILTRFTEFENIPMVALVVIFITIMILPPLHKELSVLLRSHVSLITFYEMTPVEQKESIDNIHKTIQLTKRENEIVALLLKGRTYKMIADELYVSENTIKTHIKNIYSKFNVKSKRELIYLFLEEKTGTD
jgi:DNA-binding CsgD family transcriptional regulator